jgi:TRAP transporter TAXI family solute receptor
MFSPKELPNSQSRILRMRKNLIIPCLWAIVLFHHMPAELRAEPRFVTIGSGGIAGNYYPTGLVIATMINSKRDVYGIRAAVEPTSGSVFNANAVLAGYMEFGLLQSDVQYQAVNGQADWKKKGPQKDLRAVFSMHHESVCLVAAVDAGIETIGDLDGKRVNLGVPGSGGYQNAVNVLEAMGLDSRRDIVPEKKAAPESPQLLQDNSIDAFFCTVGHPSEMLVEAVSGSRKVRFVPITGAGIEKLIADRVYYTKTMLPVATFYPGAETPVDLETLGVIATLCTSARVPDFAVYVIAKEVFDNFDHFRRRHPAFATLTKKGMLEGLSAPFHPGATKYFKEVGLTY